MTKGTITLCAPRCRCCQGSGRQSTRAPQLSPFSRLAHCPQCDGAGHEDARALFVLDMGQAMYADYVRRIDAEIMRAFR